MWIFATLPSLCSFSVYSTHIENLFLKVGRPHKPDYNSVFFRHRIENLGKIWTWNWEYWVDSKNVMFTKWPHYTFSNVCCIRKVKLNWNRFICLYKHVNYWNLTVTALWRQCHTVLWLVLIAIFPCSHLFGFIQYVNISYRTHLGFWLRNSVSKSDKCMAFVCHTYDIMPSLPSA